MGFQDFLKKTSSEVSTASTADMVAELEKRNGSKNIFPLEVFHPRIKPFIQELHTKFDMPRAYVGLSMLMAYSTAIGNAYAVTRNGSDRLPLCLWGCMNGISSSGKTFALDTCLKPIRDIQEEFDQAWSDSARGLTDEKRQRLQIKSLVYRDAYIPTLIRSILPYNPKGVLKISDEILEWINGLNAMGKKESTDEQFWLSAWDGQNYSAIRSGNVVINIPRVFTNIIGGIQPDLLYKLFKNERGTSGFIFRLLFAQPEEHKIARPAYGYDIPVEFKTIHKEHLTKLYKALPVDDGYDDPKVCVISKEAFKVIARWEGDKITMINNIPDLRERNVHSGILGKMKAYANRFAGILAVTDYAYEMDSQSTYFRDQLAITEDIMVRAIKLAEYFYMSAVSIYEAVDRSVTAPMDVLEMATLFKMGTPISRMAEVILKDKKAKGQMHRKLTKAIKEYPKVFGAIVHNQ